MAGVRVPVRTMWSWYVIVTVLAVKCASQPASQKTPIEINDWSAKIRNEVNFSRCFWDIGPIQFAFMGGGRNGAIGHSNVNGFVVVRRFLTGNESVLKFAVAPGSSFFVFFRMRTRTN